MFVWDKKHYWEDWTRTENFEEQIDPNIFLTNSKRHLFKYEKATTSLLILARNSYECDTDRYKEDIAVYPIHCKIVFYSGVKLSTHEINK